MVRVVRALGVAAMVAFCAPAAGQGIIRQNAAPPWPILSGQINGAAPAGTVVYAATVVPTDRSVTVTAAGIYVYTAGGGGAGTTVVRVSDGTNNCDSTIACTDSQSTGLKLGVLSGTCVFAPGVTLTIASQSSTCTTSQPSVRNVTAIVRPSR